MDVQHSQYDQKHNVSDNNIPIFCSACGKRLTPGDPFCPGCGARLQAPSSQVQQTNDSSRAQQESTLNEAQSQLVASSKSFDGRTIYLIAKIVSIFAAVTIIILSTVYIGRQPSYFQSDAGAPKMVQPEDEEKSSEEKAKDEEKASFTSDDWSAVWALRYINSYLVSTGLSEDGIDFTSLRSVPFDDKNNFFVATYEHDGRQLMIGIPMGKDATESTCYVSSFYGDRHFYEDRTQKYIITEFRSKKSNAKTYSIAKYAPYVKGYLLPSN